MSNECKGVSNCYVFKSRLQEYAQKVGFPTPVYETIKEGPSHEPFFRSTVVVNNVRYESLPGFSNRKAAEQSAAEVALMELAKCGDMKECISQPVHETGLCKNLLQEYAQKMNYAVPTYECRKQDAAGRITNFSCTVEIGGIRYIGAFARTKKEAEIKAARTALLAIQSSSSEMIGNPIEETHYTVLPCKRKEPEAVTSEQEAVKTRKPKKGRFRKKFLKKRHHVGGANQIHLGKRGAMSPNLGSHATTAPSLNGLLNVVISDSQVPVDADGSPNMNQSHGDVSVSEGLVMPNVQISGRQTINMNMTSTVQDGMSNTNQIPGGIISALEAGFRPFGNGFSNSQISECQPVCNETLNMNHSHGNGSASEVSVASLVTNSNSMQKSDAVDLPALRCIVQPSSLSQTGVSNSKHDEQSVGFPNSQVSEWQPVAEGATGTVHNETLNMNHSHGDGSATEVLGVSLVINSGFPNSQVSEWQPVAEGLTETVHNETLNMNHCHGDGSASEVLGVSLVTNSTSMPKNDVSNSKQEGEETGGLGDSSVLVEDFSMLVSGVVSLEANKNACIEHVGSVMNATNQNEPAAVVSSMDDTGDGALQTNNA